MAWLLRPSLPFQRRRRFDLAEEARDASISALIGICLTFLMFLARPEPFGWRLALYGAQTGLLFFLCCRLLHEFVGKAISCRKLLPAPLAAAMVFFFGGALGWGISLLLSRATGLVRFRFSLREIVIAFAIAGLIGIAIGLVFYFFGRLEDRLKESGARLKEAEFAEKELELARSIQARLLPPGEVTGDGYRITARNLPARFVAGDFYDIFHLADGALGLVVADVAGKGIGASLIMASVKAVVPLLAAGRSASETVTELNRKLSRELAVREFVALCFARFDAARGALEIANAGLPDPYHLRTGDGPASLSVPGCRLPLGARSGAVYESLAVTLDPGDRVLFLTDGLPEAPTPAGEPLGYEAFVRLLTAAAPARGDVLERLFDAVRSATKDGLEDDWTALVLERC